MYTIALTVKDGSLVFGDMYELQRSSQFDYSKARNDKTILSLTAHYIYDNKICSNTLTTYEVIESHTAAANTAAVITEILGKWNAYGNVVTEVYIRIRPPVAVCGTAYGAVRIGIASVGLVSRSTKVTSIAAIYLRLPTDANVSCLNGVNKEEDYHSEMNEHNFHKWVTEKLIHNITYPSIIVMDNAPYHSIIVKNKAPTSANKFDDLRLWLLENNVSFDPNLRKPALLALVRKNKPEPVYEIDEAAIIIVIVV
ncbi:unnamed protein product [Plutella xylostella]|uniref:(diamondback moth) hypothetical protein n=1 Tax=Plutella xylostella TaxID=51655 RepID=A0A8S4FQ39_PLUXY|nr:unnamed protein product [Plutella xylostella]